MAKFLLSKFNGHCVDCGADINRGELVYWLGKGKGVQCQNCAPRIADSDQPHPVADTGGDSWSSALAWQPAPPVGASIGNDSKPAATPSQPAAEKPADNVVAGRFKPERTDDVDTLPAAERAKHYAAQYDAYQQRAEHAERVERDQPPKHDDAVAIIRDMLVLLVNAIDRADRDQRAALDSIARDAMANAGSMSRSRIWAALADVINA